MPESNSNVTRRQFVAIGAAAAATAATAAFGMSGCSNASSSTSSSSTTSEKGTTVTKPGTGGERYIPMSERDGNTSIVYFTRDLSADGLRKLYARVNDGITGKVGIKLHTGEANGPNIIPRPWVQELMEKDLPNSAIVETNSYYEGDRDSQGN